MVLEELPIYKSYHEAELPSYHEAELPKNSNDLESLNESHCRRLLLAYNDYDTSAADIKRKNTFNHLLLRMLQFRNNYLTKKKRKNTSSIQQKLMIKFALTSKYLFVKIIYQCGSNILVFILAIALYLLLIISIQLYVPSLHSSCVITSEQRSLDPTEEENCLIEKICHDDARIDTDLDSSQIIHYNLYPRITHAQADRGDKPLVSTLNSDSSFRSLKKPTISNNLRSFTSTDDGSSLNEATVGISSGYCTGTSDYSQSSFKAQITGAGKSHLERSNLTGVYSEADRVLYRKVNVQTPDINPNKLDNAPSDLDTQLKYRDYTIVQSKYNDHDRHVHTSPDGLLPTKHQHVQKPQPFSTTTVTANKVAKANKIAGYNKSTYTVLVGNSVKVYSTKLSSLPHHNKFMVKERMKETNKVKLILISDAVQRCVAMVVIP